jgi:hypothetical protein
MMQQKLDRRRDTRIRSGLPFTIYVDGTARECRALDVSVSGALVERPSQRPPPLVHRVLLTLDDGQQIEALARTVWSDETTHAVRFVQMAEFDRLEIAEHLDRRQRDIAQRRARRLRS